MSADPYATDDTTTDATTTDYAAEEVAAPEEEAKNPTILYFGWGILHIWMAVLGFMIYGYYPGMINSNTWWKNQCPTTLWTSALAPGTTALPQVLIGGTGTAAFTVVNATWTNSTCLKAAPVSQWSTVAWTALIGNGLMSLVWILNTIIGNNGGMLHMIFWRASQASALLALLELVFEFMAMTSYGTQSNVTNSWFGLPSATMAAPTATVAGVYTPGTLTPTTWTPATSDFKYLMWKTPAAIVPLSTDYSIYGQLFNLAYDANANTSTYLSLISTVLKVAVIVLSFGPFGAWYKHQADLAAAPMYDEDGCDADGYDVEGNPCPAAADESNYDAYGCNSSALDVYGNECPAPAY